MESQSVGEKIDSINCHILRVEINQYKIIDWYRYISQHGPSHPGLSFLTSATNHKN